MAAQTLMPNSGALDMGAAVHSELAGCTLHLVNAAFVPTPTTTPADMTAIEANYTGYAPITIANFLPPMLDTDGGVTLVAPTVQFASTGPAVSNNIYGWFLMKGSGTLMMCGTFDQALPMENVGSAINATVAINLARNDEITCTVEYAP